MLALLIITPLLFIAALWISPRRRRTLLQLTIGGMLGLIVIRRALFWLQSGLTAQAKPANRAALSVITGQVFHGLFTVTLWFLIGAAPSPPPTGPAADAAAGPLTPTGRGGGCAAALWLLRRWRSDHLPGVMAGRAGEGLSD